MEMSYLNLKYVKVVSYMGGVTVCELSLGKTLRYSNTDDAVTL